MGTKFGNIHIITCDRSKAISALKNISSGRAQKNVNLEMHSDFEWIFEELAGLKNIYYLGELRPGWVSILNDSFDWGEVEAFGEELSRYISSPILTIAYFDDDLLELNLFFNGELQTGQLWCSEEIKAAYGLKEKIADVSILTQHIGYQHENKLNEILSKNDCEQAVEELQNLLGIPLWIKSSWLENIDNKEIIKKFEKLDLSN